MSELTQTDGAFQNVAANGDEKDWDADANRWTKGDNDRLYVDGCKFVDYVALDSLIVLTNGSGVDATAEINGDELTLEITRDDGINHKEWTATFALPEDLAEETADDDSTEDEDESEFVVDGGEVEAQHVDDDTIEQAIAQNDDPDHPDALTVEAARYILGCIDRSFAAVWGMHMDAVEDGSLEVVAETDDLVVFADHMGTMWGDEFEHGELEDVDLDRNDRLVIQQIHHMLAKDICDYSWSTAEPFVIRKPDGFNAGQRYVEAVVNSLQQRDLSPGQAWAYYGVEIRGNYMNAWGKRKGDHDHKNVSDALEKAREKLP